MDNQYLKLMKKILEEGIEREDRTGVGTYSLFGERLEFNLLGQFPASLTKKLFFKTMQKELAWMLKGETNVKPLQEQNVHIWDEWADPETGELGPIYGAQWRSWETVDSEPGKRFWADQVITLLKGLVENPFSRRHILSAWNVGALSQMKLPPCHLLCQFYVTKCRDSHYYLSCHMYQRSCDYFLGAPFNIAQYALLTEAICATLTTPETLWQADRLIISYGDVHIYKNHTAACLTQSRRYNKYDRSRRPLLSVPRYKARGGASDVHRLIKSVENAELLNYNPMPAIKAEIAV